jgi:hypothetical protein
MADNFILKKRWGAFKPPMRRRRIVMVPAGRCEDDRLEPKTPCWAVRERVDQAVPIYGMGAGRTQLSYSPFL